MNKDILRQLGFSRAVKRVEAGQCPTCGKIIVMTDFRDPLSRKEFRISGMCQSCQDSVFGT